MEEENKVNEEDNLVENNVAEENNVVEEDNIAEENIEVQENSSTEEINNVEETNIEESNVVENDKTKENEKESESKGSKVIYIIVITVIVLLILGLIGVLVYFNTSNEIKDDTVTEKKPKEVVDTNKYEVSNNWKEYVVSVFNKTIKLPTTYERVEALSGFKLDSTNSKNYIRANSNDIVNLYVDDKLALYVYVKNDKDEEIEYTNSKVIGIWQSKYEVETNHVEKIVFPGNIVVGQDMNRDTLVSLFGEPSDVRNTNLENYVTEDYYYYEDEKSITEKYYRITVVNGKISDIYLVTEK